MTYDCLELIENQGNIWEENDNCEIKNKNDIIKALFGDKYYQKLKNLNLLQVGAGAIGCELLKNFSVLGIGEGDEGKIYITDPDVIEVSNLTRQFLFREKHLRLPKSSTAAAAAVQMNKNLKGHIFAKSEKLCEQTEYIFSDEFFKKLDVVANALDNVNARKYVDLRCTNNRISLLESGTHGPKGHVQVIIPFKTENYASQEDPENSGGEIPQCTLKMFPEETIHCLEWARDQFGKNFTQFPQDFNKIIYNIKNDLVQKDEFKKMKTCLKWLKKLPRNFEDCVKLAKEKYYKVFIYNIKKLLMVYPLDKKDKEGNLFWSLPKRPPKMINFDIKNNLCIDFIAAYSFLIANMFNIDIKFKNPKSEEFKNEIIILVDRIKIDEKKLTENINLNSINEKYQKLEQEKDKKNITSENNYDTNPNETFDDKEFESLKNELISYTQKIGVEKIPNLIPIEFEKDNDMNGQIDLIYSMSGLRALNYSLVPYDWITCKIKAGKIIPALSTTTSCISALQTLELLKLIKGLDVKYFRNTFLNLAIPFMQSSEPGNVVNKKICGDLMSNVWDIWEINICKNKKEENCIKFLFEELKKKYKIYPKDIFIGKKPIYLSLIHKGNQNIENMTLTDLFGININSKYLDIIVTFTEKEESDIYLKNIPRIRINFK
jgi:molybdopterin/thiamine biosynthesis adenylyltransferase